MARRATVAVTWGDIPPVSPPPVEEQWFAEDGVQVFGHTADEQGVPVIDPVAHLLADGRRYFLQ